MRTALALLLIGCATTSRYTYEEAAECPARMNEDEYYSGVVRCRALCSSYARDFASYDQNCKCWCAPTAATM